MENGGHAWPSLPGMAEGYQDARRRASTLPHLRISRVAAMDSEARVPDGLICLSFPHQLPAYKMTDVSIAEGTMTYKTVMVSLALGRPNDSRLEVAAQLAERFGARVIGVAAAEFSPPLYFTEGGAAQQLIDQGWAAVENRL